MQKCKCNYIEIKQHCVCIYLHMNSIQGMQVVQHYGVDKQQSTVTILISILIRTVSMVMVWSPILNFDQIVNCKLIGHL